MDGPDLMYYLTWLKDQLRLPVCFKKCLTVNFLLKLYLIVATVLRATSTFKRTLDVYK